MQAGLSSGGSPQVGSDLGEIAGIGKLGVKVSNDPEWLLAQVDGVIDFTVPAATVTLSEIAARRRLVHVIGTTGLSETDEGKIRDAARQARIVKSGNMSVGVNLLAALVEKIARTLPSNFDIEIVEMHHRHKVDAPSGTALLLGEAAAAGRNIELKEKAIRGRDGQTGARPPGHIGFGSLRGGSVVGEHSVIFAGPSERIELVHRAEFERYFCPWCHAGSALGKRQAARALQHRRCYGTGRLNPRENVMNMLLVLVRHGQSDWNLKNLFTGWKDPGLTEQGIAEAKAAGEKLKQDGYRFDVAFTSDLKRAQDTLDIMLDKLGQTDLPVIKNKALNERDYGELTGLNKDDARQRWGEEQVHIWRRSFDIAPPGGESLKDTAARVLPYFKKEILPRVLKGERALVSAHGNSLRALIMALENLSGEEIVRRELETGVPIVYQLKDDGSVQSKETLKLS